MANTQIPLAELLQQQPNLPTTSLADLDEEMLAQIYFQHRRPAPSMSEELQFKYAALGLAALSLLGATFTGWLYRPINEQANAQVMRDIGQALIMQQQQVEQAIATANPPQYKCNSLIGDCHFPEASAPTLTVAELNQLLSAQQQQNQPTPTAYAAY